MLHRSIPVDTEKAHQDWGAELAPVVMAMGRPRFIHELHRAVGASVRASHVTIVEFSPRLTPSLFLISSTHQEERAERYAKAYFEEYYRFDPNYGSLRNLVGPSAISLVRRDEAEFSKSYRKRFFQNQNIADKLTILCDVDDMLISSSIYKDDRDGAFSDREIDHIASLAPLISATASRHCQLLGISRIDLEMIVYAMAAKRAISLTSRESDVCQGILRGQSSEAVALSLGIAPSSVITHRKNLYRKLNIVSQAELFAQAFDTVAGAG